VVGIYAAWLHEAHAEKGMWETLKAEQMAIGAIDFFFFCLWEKNRGSQPYLSDLQD
jgi:hypothetical protein